MSKFRFWSTVIFAIIFGVLGVLGAGILPLPSPFSINQSKTIYALIGVLLALMAVGKVSGWVVAKTTILITNLIGRLAIEIINQVYKLAAKGWSLTPALERILSEVGGTEEKHFQGGIIVDTSSIIDGRMLEVAKTGFLSGPILIPNFVLSELQQVADSADGLKRARGRRGFEIINHLKKIPGIKLQVLEEEVAGKNVDDKLIRLGKKLHSRVLTCDFNLNRVATLSGVKVLNLNDLTNALKTLPVPGEKLNIQVIQEGKDKKQGVGYLTDGTMVVVQNAASLIGQEIEVEVNKIIQGPSGRILFGRSEDRNTRISENK